MSLLRHIGALSVVAVLCVWVPNLAWAKQPLQVERETTLELGGPRFGSAVATIRGHLAVGAPGAESEGRVTIYDETFQVAAVASRVPPVQYDFFGAALSSDRGAFFVGSPGVSEVYQLAADGSVQAVFVSPGRPTNFQVPEAAQFGLAVAASGGYLAVLYREPAGPHVAVYEIERQQFVWQSALPADCDDGVSVAAQRRVLAVAAGCAQLEPSTRRVFLFDFRDGEPRTELSSPDPSLANSFGSSLAFVPIRSQLLVVGAMAQNGGAAFAFDVRTGALVETYRPPSEDGLAADQYFGRSVAASKQLVAVSAAQYGFGGGGVYLFDRRTGAQLTVLGNHLDHGEYGRGLAFMGSRVVIGSAGDPHDGYVDIFRIGK